MTENIMETIKDNIYKTIDVIVDQRIEDLKLDKTVKGTIQQCVNSSLGEYKINYNGGIITAYTKPDDTTVYYKNMAVYINIPENNFSNKKWIIGKVSSITPKAETEYQSLSSDTSNYSAIGSSLILPTTDKPSTDEPPFFGLNSYSSKTQELVLYDNKNKPNDNKLDYQKGILKVFLKQLDALKVHVEFQNQLPNEQKVEPKADYGLKIIINYKNQNDAYKTKQDWWDKVKPLSAMRVTTAGSTPEIRDLSYYEIDWNQQDWLTEVQTKSENLPVFINYLSSKTTIEIANLYLALLQDLQTVNSRQLAKEMYEKWFAEKNTTGVLEPGVYTFNTSKMRGNPFNYVNWNSFDFIIPIGDKELDDISSIIFYKTGFKSTPKKEDDNYNESYKYQMNDLFIRNILITPVKIKNPELIDYDIIFNFNPTNVLFTENTQTIVTPIIYYKNQNITSACSFWWFRQDPTIKISSEEGYHAYGGEGWRFLEQTSAENDRAGIEISDNGWAFSYNNTFKLVVMYNGELAASDQFFVINKNSQYTVEITCDSGTDFELAEGTKTLICTVNGQEIPILPEGSTYIYKWYRKAPDKRDPLFFEKTEEEIKEELNDPTTIGILKREKEEYLSLIEGIKWEGQTLLYPSSKIIGNITIGCTVYLRQEEEEDTLIGEDTIELSQGGGDASLTGYYIEIENGSQVFQYTESGISPASPAASLSPLQIKQLTCKFYTPNKGLVNPSMYTVRWEYPISNTLIITPNELKLTKDPVTKLENIYEDSDKSGCSFLIQNNYDYGCINNQIICHVTFHDKEYRQSTSFYFGKMGENGTNGTDTIARIAPTVLEGDILTAEPLVLVRQTNRNNNNEIEFSDQWNTGQLTKEPVLEMRLYRNGTEISPGDYLEPTWSLVNNLSTKTNYNSGNSNNLLISSDSVSDKGFPACAIEINKGISIIDENTGELDITPNNANLILKGRISLQRTQENNLQEIIRAYNQDYYCYYPIIFKQRFRTSERITIDKTKTLREVVYNSAGYYPQYDTSLGVKLNLKMASGINCTAYKITYEAFGGEKYTSGLTENDLNDPDFWIITPEGKAVFSYTGYYADSSAETSWIDSEENPIELSPEVDFVRIRPKEIYSGFRVNYVKVSIAYTPKAIDSEDSPTWSYKLCTYYIPFYFSLNTHELASLNGWDGNSLAINNEGGYILAPQMGAGIKDDGDNTFTGLVMGIEQKAAQNNEIGLFGYSHGKRSIFLDAKTGNATFGLPETDNIWEGRIELRPGGTSSIAGWTFDNTSLSKVASVEQTSHILTDTSSTSYYTQGNSLITNNLDKNQTGLVKPYGLGISTPTNSKIPYWVSVEDAFKDAKRLNNPIKSPKGAKGAVPHDQQGIILNANPAYISVKGRPLGINLDKFLDDPSNTGSITRQKLVDWRNWTPDEEGNPHPRFPNQIDTGMTFKDDWTDTNAQDSFLMIGDSLEVELNPNSPSIFGIYQHTLDEKGPDGSSGKPTWKRYLVSGIDEYGRFFSNAARDGSTSLLLGGLGAFGKDADSDAGYKGTYVEDNKRKIFSFFIKKSRYTDNTSSVAEDLECPVYLSTHHHSGSPGLQGSRPLSIIARKISIYSGNNKDCDPYEEIDTVREDGESFTHKQMFDKQTISRLELDDNQVLLGYNITDNNTAGQLLLRYSDNASKLIVPGQFEQTIGGATWAENDLDRKYRIKVNGDKYEYLFDKQTNHIYARGWYIIDSTTSPSTKVYYNPLENDSTWSNVESVTTIGGQKYEKIKSNYRIDMGGKQIKAINGAAWEEEDLTSRAYQIKVNGSKYEYIKNYQTNHIYAAGWGTDNNGNSIHPADEIDSNWTGVASITTIGGSKYEKIQTNCKLDIGGYQVNETGSYQTNNIGGYQINKTGNYQINIIGKAPESQSESYSYNYYQNNTIYGHQDNKIYDYQSNLINNADWEDGDKKTRTLRTKVNGSKYEYIKTYQINHIYAQGWPEITVTSANESFTSKHPQYHIDSGWTSAESITTIGGRKYENIKSDYRIDIGGKQIKAINGATWASKDLTNRSYQIKVNGGKYEYLYDRQTNHIYAQGWGTEENPIHPADEIDTGWSTAASVTTVGGQKYEKIKSNYNLNIGGYQYDYVKSQQINHIYAVGWSSNEEEPIHPSDMVDNNWSGAASVTTIGGRKYEKIKGNVRTDIGGYYNINIDNTTTSSSFNLTINRPDSKKVFRETELIPTGIWTSSGIDTTYKGWLLESRLHISHGLVIGINNNHDGINDDHYGIQISGNDGTSKQYSIVAKNGLFTKGSVYAKETIYTEENVEVKKNLTAETLILTNTNPKINVIDIANGTLNINNKGLIQFNGKLDENDSSEEEKHVQLSFGKVIATSTGNPTPAAMIAGGLKVTKKTELNTLTVTGTTNFDNLTTNFNGDISLIKNSLRIKNDVQNDTKRIVGQFIDANYTKPRLGIAVKNNNEEWDWRTYLAEDKIVITEGTYLDEDNIVITKDDKRIQGWFQDNGHARLAVRKLNSENKWSSVAYLDTEDGFHGDGTNIKNTASGYGTSPSINTHYPDFGSKVEITIPEITMSNGRPDFSSSSVWFNVPSFPDLSDYTTFAAIRNGLSLGISGNTITLYFNNQFCDSVVLPSNSTE